MASDAMATAAAQMIGGATVRFALAGALLAAGGCGGGGGGEEKPSLTATVLFPPAASMTPADTLTVRGTASGKAAITGVTVDGIPAVSSDGFATWSCAVPLLPGGNSFDVGVTDALGRSVARAVRFTVERDVPLLALTGGAAASETRLILFDRLVGVVEHDLTTGISTIVAAASAAGTPPDDELIVATGASDSADVLCVQSQADGILRCLDLATGTWTTVSDPDNAVGSGPTVGVSRDGALSADGATWYQIGHLEDSLLAVDLATGTRTIITDATTVGAGPSLNIPSLLAMDEAGGQALVWDTGLESLFSVALSNGDRTILSSAGVGSGPLPVGPAALQFDAVDGRALLLDDDGTGAFDLLAIDLVTGDRELLDTLAPGVNDGDADITEMGTFPVSGDLLLVDTVASNVWRHDPATDATTLLLSTRVGNGPAMTGVASLARDPTSGRIWVIDGGATPDRVVRVDGGDGDRSVVAGVGSGVALSGTPTAIRWHASSAALLLTAGSPATLVRASPTTFSQTLAWDGEDGVGTDIDVVGFGVRADGTVLGGSQSTGDLASADPDAGTGARITVTAANGFDIGDLRGFVVDEALGVSATAYAIEPAAAAVASIDLASGVATVLASAGAGSGPLPGIGGLAAADDRATLYVSGVGATGGLLAIDVGSGVRTVISPATSTSGPIAGECPDFVIDGERLWGLAAGRAVILFDLATGERVLVSN